MATAAKKVVPQRRTTAASDDAADIVQSTTGEKIALEQEQDDGEMVTVIIPSPFKITRAHDVIKEYEAGVQEMPEIDAAHWFARAMGVKVYKG